VGAIEDNRSAEIEPASDHEAVWGDPLGSTIAPLRPTTVPMAVRPMYGSPAMAQNQLNIDGYSERARLLHSCNFERPFARCARKKPLIVIKSVAKGVEVGYFVT
jgi:hypothetical protein